MLSRFLVLLSLGLAHISWAQSEYTAQLFKAYLDSDMPAWKSVIDRMEADSRTCIDSNFTAELVNYQYGYVAWYLGNDGEDEAEKYLVVAEKNLSWLEEKKYNPSLTAAYRAAFYGFWIGISTWNFVSYGSKCTDEAELAVKLDPDNSFAYLQWGNIRYYQPSFVGGSVPEALDYYEKAKKLMENQSQNLERNWVYLNLLVTLGEAHEKFENYSKAEEFYKKVLQLQPTYGYVKDIKYPALLQKVSAK